jgi:hypothetical protein
LGQLGAGSQHRAFQFGLGCRGIGWLDVLSGFVQLLQYSDALRHQQRALRRVLFIRDFAGEVIEIQIAQRGQDGLPFGGQTGGVGGCSFGGLGRLQQRPGDDESDEQDQTNGQEK